MNCPNCKKDLVFGHECEDCKTIVFPSQVVVETSVAEEAPVEVPVKKVKKLSPAKR